MQRRLTIERFEAAQLSASEFTHEGHVYVAWLYLQRYPGREAIDRFDSALQRLVKELGAEQKYNAMITWLFMKLIRERMESDQSWEQFCERNRDLFDEWPRS